MRTCSTAMSSFKIQITIKIILSERQTYLDSKKQVSTKKKALVIMSSWRKT